MNLKWMTIGAAAFMLSSLSMAKVGQQQQTFTLADLQKMVDELKPYLPEDPRFTYPIKCVVENIEKVNANASIEFDPKGDKDQKPRAKMTVYTGLLTFMKEVRLVRAVVAHELAHLSKQHLGKGYKTQDLSLILTRQQEYEADVTGAIVLEKAGYSKKDMVDMLMKLGESSKDWPGSDKILGDHADVARRAANVDGSSLVLRSMVSFTTGDAYMDTRNYLQAMRAYDKASLEAPKFYESKYNAAQASLLNYYTNVAQSIVDTWYIPDFGPTLSMPVWTPKAAVINDQDRRNYAIALEHVKAAMDSDPSRRESLELQGLALVLDPDGKPENLREGIKSLSSAQSKAMTETDKLRIANNLALGYQRSGDVNKAFATMIASQRGSNKYNPFLAVNLGQQVPGDEFKSDAVKAEQVIYTYLTRTPKAAMGYQKALDNYPAFCKKFGLKVRDIKVTPTYLSTVLSLTEKGQTVNILDPIEDILRNFGKAQTAYKYSDTYQGMRELIWDNGNFSILLDMRDVAGEKISEVLRITSYTKGSSFNVMPTNQTITTGFKVVVGMTTASFNEFLDLKAGISRSLVKAGTIEEWTYFPGLNMGVLVKDDKIAGITVAPVELPAQE
jgi:tetratricopeptide (TPR) repeat protein